MSRIGKSPITLPRGVEITTTGGQISVDLLQLYAENSDAQVHKWHHYIPLYDRYFSPYRNRPIRFLEIGVSRGGSLNLWRQYFGPAAVMFGIDINPDCSATLGRV